MSLTTSSSPHHRYIGIIVSPLRISQEEKKCEMSSSGADIPRLLAGHWLGRRDGNSSRASQIEMPSYIWVSKSISGISRPWMLSPVICFRHCHRPPWCCSVISSSQPLQWYWPPIFQKPTSCVVLKMLLQKRSRAAMITSDFVQKQRTTIWSRGSTQT